VVKLLIIKVISFSREVNLKKTFSVLALALFLSAITVSATLNTQEKAPEKEFVKVKEVSPFSYCCIPHKGPFTEIEGVIGQLMQAIQEQKIAPAGTMIGVYYNNPEMVKPEDLVWEMGFPVSPQTEVKAPLEKKQWKFSPVLIAIHKGPYEETGNTYNKMFHWMQENSLTQTGPVLERYLTMPGPDTKPEDLRSELWVPFQK
jgi:effector-binding domain-containing protein